MVTLSNPLAFMKTRSGFTSFMGESHPKLSTMAQLTLSEVNHVCRARGTPLHVELEWPSTVGQSSQQFRQPCLLNFANQSTELFPRGCSVLAPGLKLRASVHHWF